MTSAEAPATCERCEARLTVHFEHDATDGVDASEALAYFLAANVIPCSQCGTPLRTTTPRTEPSWRPSIRWGAFRGARLA